jgi:hypothetical protein
MLPTPMLAAAATPDDCYPGASFFVNLETERRWFSFGAHSLQLIAVSTSKCTDHDLTIGTATDEQ